MENILYRKNKNCRPIRPMFDRIIIEINLLVKKK